MKVKHASDIGLIRVFSIIKHILRTMNDYRKMLRNASDTNYRENDYFRILWSPLLELFFPPSENVRIASAESEYLLSIKEKKVLYPKTKYIHGLKIDIRLVVDINREELDLAIGECAKHNSDSKSIQDVDKLLREAKDALDGIIQNTHGYNCRLMTYFIQITGTHCSLSTMELAKNGLYVSKHRHSFNFPSTISDLSKLPITLNHLLQMKKEVNIAADKILQALTTSIGGEESFNCPSVSQKNKRLAWMRDTWYTPPREKTSQIPVHMFTPPHPLFKIPDDETSEEEAADGGLPDKFGWVKYAENDFFNVLSKESSTENPYE
ncbi:hypothetical protein BDB01DRAFT_809275 [Pilobolus umbonatus]|nr:hypothetical protein BDB01DRAFT_809275 [Pilobolus umbonatus]